MSESARVLRFPSPTQAGVPCIKDPKETARDYMSLRLDQRTELALETLLSSPDVLVALCTQFREMLDSSPAKVIDEASRLYFWISASTQTLGLFDERDYFLGELALIAGSAERLVGNLHQAESWFDRADSGFRHTINPAPLLASLSYARLALRFESGRYADVLDLIPSLVLSFRKLGMDIEEAKCLFLQAKTLMQIGKASESLPILNALRESPTVRSNRVLLANVLIYAGNCYGSIGQFEDASRIYSEALPVAQQGGPSSSLAQLKWSIGDTCKAQGKLSNATEAYRSAQRDFAEMSMPRYVALLRLVIAETLLSLGRGREAEWEILAALPTIEEQGMVPEGFAAVALLGESVRRRKTDPRALRELREHLRAKN